MRELSLKEMQEIELNILKVFDRLCKENRLRYYIDGGTLLGAMCYEGFIPWDDDIDIKMPRSDYEKLSELSDLLPDGISVEMPSKENCCYLFAKVVDTRTVLYENGTSKKTGVYVDIFPMDGLPDDNDICRTHLKKLSRLNSLFHNSLSGFSKMIHSGNVLSKIKGLVYKRIYTPSLLFKKLTKTAEKYDYDSCEYVGLLIEGNPEKEKMPRKALENCISLKFEGGYYPAPSNYMEHMATFYGDHVLKEECYHNLPHYPAVHDQKAYMKD